MKTALKALSANSAVLCVRKIAALEAELAKTRRLKQGMMQELLTGKTR